MNTEKKEKKKRKRRGPYDGSWRSGVFFLVWGIKGFNEAVAQGWGLSKRQQAPCPWLLEPLPDPPAQTGPCPLGASHSLSPLLGRNYNGAWPCNTSGLPALCCWLILYARMELWTGQWHLSSMKVWTFCVQSWHSQLPPERHSGTLPWIHGHVNGPRLTDWSQSRVLQETVTICNYEMWRLMFSRKRQDFWQADSWSLWEVIKTAGCGCEGWGPGRKRAGVMTMFCLEYGGSYITECICQHLWLYALKGVTFTVFHLIHMTWDKK